MPGEALPSAEVVSQALAEAVAAEPTVTAAYLFGSVARGAAGPLSDLDVGLLIVDGAPSSAHICDRIMDALARRLHTSKVDVISLAGAPMPLRYQVVRDGSLVVCRDAVVLERFIVASVLQYLDFKPLRDRAFGRMRAAILTSTVDGC